VARLWAERFGLGALLDRAPHALSAGEQQRVLLAAALAIEPDLLIADEPAAHLDPRSRTRALDLVAAEVARGMAVAWITQEPAEVEWASRRIAIGAADSPPSFLPADEMRSPAFRRTEPAPSHGVRVRVDPGGLRISVESPIEFEIDGPGVWVLRGANGSGKTSLLEHLAGLVVLPEVQVSGAPAGGLPPILAPQYADRHVFEDRVRDEVLYGARRREGDLRAIEADLATWLSLLGRTAELLERRTWELSAGDRRLVSVLAALATPASWILLDEPTCGLDAERRIGMAQIVREVARRAPTVVATQDRAWDMTLGGREVLIGSEPSDPGEESPKNAKSQQKNGLTRPCNTT
jgi:energy-coupling factor transport system ATP-binding protein